MILICLAWWFARDIFFFRRCGDYEWGSDGQSPAEGLLTYRGKFFIVFKASLSMLLSPVLLKLGTQPMEVLNCVDYSLTPNRTRASLAPQGS